MSPVVDSPAVAFSTDGQAPPLSFRRDHLGSTLAALLGAALVLAFLASLGLMAIGYERVRANRGCTNAVEGDRAGIVIASGSRSVTCDYPNNGVVRRQTFSYEWWPPVLIGGLALVEIPVSMRLYRRRSA